MAMTKQPHGPPMTLGDMRHLGVRNLIAFRLNAACRHQGLVDVSKYPDDAEVRSFSRNVVCAKWAIETGLIAPQEFGRTNAAKPLNVCGPVRRRPRLRGPTALMPRRSDA